LYAYGFLSREIWQLLHPRQRRACLNWTKRFWSWSAPSEPCTPAILRQPLEASGSSMLGAVTRRPPRVRWNGCITTDFFELLIVKKEYGYMKAVPPVSASLSPDGAAARVGACGREHPGTGAGETLHSITSFVRRPIAKAPNHRKTIQRLISDGKLERQVIDEIGYLWPAPTVVSEPPPRLVRFWLPLIRWYGIACDLSIFGDGLIGLKLIRHPPSVSAATTRCRFSGAIG